MATTTPVNSLAVSLFGNDTSLSTRKSKAGKDIGTRATFGEHTASEIRASLKANGLKGAELTRQVNAVLTGSKDFAWAKANAVMSALQSKGFIADYADVSAKGNSATMRFVRPTIPVERPVQVTTVDVASLTPESIAKLTPESLAALRKALGM